MADISIDFSNWQVISPSVVSCIKTSTSAPVVGRLSLESAALQQTAITQLQLFHEQSVDTMGYSWCYGSDTPELVAQQTVTIFDPYLSVKRIWADVEDVTNFLSEHPNRVLPRRLAFQSIIEKRRLSNHSMSSLLGLVPTAAVSWLRRWVNELRTLGYTPGLYSAPGVWQTITASSLAFQDVDGWGADWDGSTDLSVIQPWGGISNWCGKQYAGSGASASLCSQSFDMSSWDNSKLIPAPQPAPQPDVVDALTRANTALPLAEQLVDELKNIIANLST